MLSSFLTPARLLLGLGFMDLTESGGLRPTPADSLSVSVFSTANSFSLLSVSVPVSSRLRICTPHAVYDSWGPRAGGGACSLLRRGERNRGKGECRYTASVLRRRMRRLLESEIVTQSVYNADAEWDGECCWSWSYKDCWWWCWVRNVWHYAIVRVLWWHLHSFISTRLRIH
jgi:hypothetical protein